MLTCFPCCFRRAASHEPSQCRSASRARWRDATGRCAAESPAPLLLDQPSANPCATGHGRALEVSLVPKWGEARTTSHCGSCKGVHPHRLFKCCEFGSGFIEHFEGARLRFPDIPSSPIEFVKGCNYQLGVTNKLKIPIMSNCIKWHMLNSACE